MGETRGFETAGESQLNWTEARAFLARCVSQRLRREKRETLEDVTQEALVRLLRASRREPVLNAEALMTSIAQRASVDFLRGRRIWQKQPSLDPEQLADDPELGVPPPDLHAPSLERIQFTALEFFKQNSAPCYELARHYFGGRNWLEVAQRDGRPHTAIRKQWSRCVEQLRAAAKENADWLWEWV